LQFSFGKYEHVHFLNNVVKFVLEQSEECQAWHLKHSASNIGIKKQPKQSSVNITWFNIEQDSGLCVADFEFFYNQLVSVNAFFGCIG
jgi:hypothetical protein